MSKYVLEATRNLKRVGRFQLQDLIAQGAFGCVYRAIDTEGGSNAPPVALKLLFEKSSVVENEVNALRSLQSLDWVPTLLESGKIDSFFYVAMPLLGTTVQKIFNVHGHHVALPHAVEVIEQTLDILESIHNLGWVHGDMKPANLMLGTLADGSEHIFLIDFGLSRRFLDKKGRHLAYKEDCPPEGSPCFASINTHLGISPSRRDDLFSLAYIAIYLSKGSLPWQYLTSKSVERLFTRIAQSKLRISIQDLCRGLPVQMERFFLYVGALSYADTPNYAYLRSLLQQMKNAYEYSFPGKFDWRQEPALKPPPPEPQATLSEADRKSPRPSSSCSTSSPLMSSAVSPHPVVPPIEGLSSTASVEGTSRSSSPCSSPEAPSDLMYSDAFQTKIPHEERDESGQLIGGDLKRLTQYFMLENDSDNEILSFLTVYRMLATATELLGSMSDVWSEQSSMCDRARTEVLKRRIFKFCSLWLSQYGETDFVSRRVSKRLIRFSEHLCTSDANRIKLSLLQAQKRASTRASTLDLKQMIKKELCATGKLHNSSLMAIEVYSPKQIALQLTLIDSVLFLHLEPSEFMRQRWIKHKDLAPSLSKLASRFNQVSFWVGSCVVEDRKPRMQARVIKHFISIAEELLRLGNFNSLGAVVAGLNNASIQRLKRAWALVSRRRVASFEQLEDLLSPMYNFRSYHDAYREHEPPRVPYVAIYLRGILFADDANPTRLESGAYNLHKILVLGKQVIEILERQVDCHRLTPLPDLLEHLLKVKPMSEDELHRRSVRCEPLKGSLAILLEEEEEMLLDSAPSSPSSCPVSPAYSPLLSPAAYLPSPASLPMLSPDLSEYSTESSVRSVDSCSSATDSYSSRPAAALLGASATTTFGSEYSESLQSFSAADLQDYLTSHPDPALVQVAPLLAELNGEQAAALDDKRLSQLGVSKLGVRKRLLRALRNASAPIGDGRRAQSAHELFGAGPRPTSSSNLSGASSSNPSALTSRRVLQKSRSGNYTVQSGLGDTIPYGARTSRPPRQRTISPACVAHEFLLPLIVSQWGRKDIELWLKAIGLDYLKPCLMSAIDSGVQLVALDKSDLASMGIVKLGPRVQLFRSIQALQRVLSSEDPRLFREVLPANVSTWNSEAVCLWFQSVGHYSHNLRSLILEQGITGPLLVRFDRVDLRELGFTETVQEILLMAIAQLIPDSAHGDRTADP